MKYSYKQRTDVATLTLEDLPELIEALSLVSNEKSERINILKSLIYQLESKKLLRLNLKVIMDFSNILRGSVGKNLSGYINTL